MDIGMIQQVLEHPCVAVFRHGLIGVLKIPVVPGNKHRDPLRDLRGDLLRPAAPLLDGIVDENFLVDKIGQHFQLGIIGLPQLQNGYLHSEPEPVDKFLFQGLGHAFGKKHGQGIQVEGDRYLPPVDHRQDPVLVFMPLGEAAEIAEGPFIGCVKKMGPVPVHQDAVAVEEIIAVAAYVRPLLNEQHLPA